MKVKSLFLTITIVGSGILAMAQSNSALKSLKAVYDRVNEADLIELHYFLSLADQARDAKQLLRESRICIKMQNYKRLPATTVIKKISSQVTRGIHLGFEDRETAAELKVELDSALAKLGSELNSQQLKVCTDRTTPAYSDGHEVNFVMVNGRLLFAFEVGRPD